MKSKGFAVVRDAKTDPGIILNPLSYQMEIFLWESSAALVASLFPKSYPLPVYISDQDEHQIGTFCGVPLVLKTKDPSVIELANLWIKDQAPILRQTHMNREYFITRKGGLKIK